MEKLSAFVTTFNIATTLGTCLESVKWADEVLSPALQAEIRDLLQKGPKCDGY